MMLSRRKFLLGSGAAIATAAVGAVPVVKLFAETAPPIQGPPTGTIVMLAGDSPGWIPCDGRVISRKAYAALFDAIGGAYGANDEAFAIPDLERHGSEGFGIKLQYGIKT